MPIPLPSKSRKHVPSHVAQVAQSGIAAQAPTATPELTSGCGVIMYTWNSAANTIEGTFVLSVYGGSLAKEVGKKTKGTSGQLPGVYDIQTFTDTGVLFATGQLILAAVGTAGAYSVQYILHPTPENLKALGYVEGTALVYDAIGYFLPDNVHLAVGWDNNLYTRNLGTAATEWGYRVVTPT